MQNHWQLFVAIKVPINCEHACTPTNQPTDSVPSGQATHTLLYCSPHAPLYDKPNIRNLFIHERRVQAITLIPVHVRLPNTHTPTNQTNRRGQVGLTTKCPLNNYSSPVSTHSTRTSNDCTIIYLCSQQYSQVNSINRQAPIHSFTHSFIARTGLVATAHPQSGSSS